MSKRIPAMSAVVDPVDQDPDLVWLSRPSSRFSRWLKARLLAGGVWLSTLWASVFAVLLSECVTVSVHLMLGLPRDTLSVSLAFGAAIPMLVAPPTVWYVVRFMFDAEAARRVAERLAATDPLTQVYNRRYFFRVGEPALAGRLLQELPVSVLLLDVDHFKSINDRWGHAVGDAVLKEVARTCQQGVTQKEVLARFGGEEFVVLLFRPSASDGLAVADQLRQSVEALRIMVAGAEPMRLTVSVGVATASTEGPSMDDLIVAADAAMYRAKQGGRNRVVACEWSGALGPQPAAEGAERADALPP